MLDNVEMIRRYWPWGRSIPKRRYRLQNAHITRTGTTDAWLWLYSMGPFVFPQDLDRADSTAHVKVWKLLSCSISYASCCDAQLGQGHTPLHDGVRRGDPGCWVDGWSLQLDASKWVMFESSHTGSLRIIIAIHVSLIFSDRCNFVNLRDEEVSLSGPSLVMPQPSLTDPAPLQVLFCCSWGKGFGSAHHVALADQVRNWPTFFCPDEARVGSQCHQCLWRGHPFAHVQWSMKQETNQNSHS